MRIFFYLLRAELALVDRLRAYNSAVAVTGLALLPDAEVCIALTSCSPSIFEEIATVQSPCTHTET